MLVHQRGGGGGGGERGGGGKGGGGGAGGGGGGGGGGDSIVVVSRYVGHRGCTLANAQTKLITKLDHFLSLIGGWGLAFPYGPTPTSSEQEKLV